MLADQAARCNLAGLAGPAGPRGNGHGPRPRVGLSGQIDKGNEFRFFQKQHLYEFDEYLNEFE
jgi:hypothetical protein